jgi:hypothetical protein
MFLARKITRPKWEQSSTVEPGEIAADAVTVDLRTTGNTLSFWTCDSAEDAKLKEVVLALAANGDRIDKFDIAWLAEETVRAEGLQVSATDGDTPVARLVKRHVDIERLDLVRLGKIASLIHAAVSGGSHKRLTKAEVQQVLVAAVQAGDLRLEDVKEGLRGELSKALEKSAANKEGRGR